MEYNQQASQVDRENLACATLPRASIHGGTSPSPLAMESTRGSEPNQCRSTMEGCRQETTVYGPIVRDNFQSPVLICSQTLCNDA